MLEEEEDAGDEARRLASGVWGIVVLLAGLLSALGVLLAPFFVRIVAPGLEAEQSELTARLMRILFPMAGVMILAAWCLGVLNSHRRFFLPFVAPVALNLTQIAGLLLGARLGWEPLVVILAWSTLAGSALQLVVQLPLSRSLAGSLRPRLETAWEPVRRVARNAVPVAASQGTLVFSGVMDFFLASFLPGGRAIAGLYFAQRIAFLPHGLFGVSVATAALPEMSREDRTDVLRDHVTAGFLRILYFALPSAIVMLIAADLIAGLLFEHGEFTATHTAFTSRILQGYALGTVAATSVKLFASAFHAQQDTTTPMRIAIVSVITGIVIGAVTTFGLFRAGWGDASAAGLSFGGACGAWLNLTLLWRGLSGRAGRLLATPAARRSAGRILVGAAIGGVAGFAARMWLVDAIQPSGTLGYLLALLGTLAAGGVPYLLIARMPAADLADRPNESG